MTDAVTAPLWTRHCGETTPRDRRNQRIYTATLAAWAVVFVGSTFVVRQVDEPSAVLWLLSAAPSFIGLAVVWAFVHYLRHADELLRTIELQALAVAVGVGFVTWPLADLALGLGAPDAFSDAPVMFMIVAYAVANRLAFWKLR